MTINEMKAFCVANDIVVEGNKTMKKTFEAAIENWKAMQAATIEVKEAIVATEEESIEPALVASLAIEEVVIAVFKALTSPQACAVYRAALQAVCLAIVFTAILLGKIAVWCWEHRDRTAVYHWVQDALNFKAFWKVRTELVIVMWILDRKVEVLTQWVDRLVRDGRDRISDGGDRALVRLGLGGCAIEIQ